MAEKVSAPEWFSKMGERVIFSGKLAASFLAVASTLYPMAATYFKVEAIQQQQQAMQQQLVVIVAKIDNLKK